MSTLAVPDEQPRPAQRPTAGTELNGPTLLRETDANWHAVGLGFDSELADHLADIASGYLHAVCRQS
jgi:hypothetical protein